MEEFKLSNFSLEQITNSADNYAFYEQNLLTCISNGESNFDFPIKTESGIILCTAGEAEICVNYKTYKIHKGVMVINFPENVLQFISNSPDYKAKVMLLSKEFSKIAVVGVNNLTANILRFKSNPCILLTPIAIDIFNKYFELLTSIIRSENDICKKESLSSLMISLSYSMQNAMVDSNSVKSDAISSRNDYIFYEFMVLLKDSYKKERRVEFYAEKFHLTPKYFSTIIKQVSSRSVSEWIDEIVMLEARSLLRFSNFSIQEIADKLNFSNASFFGKYFKHHMNVSPGKYRKEWNQSVKMD